MVFFGALRTPRARAGRQVDARGGPARKGRSPRVPGQLADLFRDAAGPSSKRSARPVKPEPPPFVTCPIGRCGADGGSRELVPRTRAVQLAPGRDAVR